MNPHTLQSVARLGYAARGSIYVAVGLLAFVSGIRGGGQAPDAQGAMMHLSNIPFGALIVAGLSIGLLGYSIWRGLQAAVDADRVGADLKGTALRVSFGVSALVHLGLAAWAAGAAIGWSRETGANSGEEGWTAWLMQQPFGAYAVMVLGLALIGVGAAHFYRAFKGSYERRLHADTKTLDVIRPIAAAGLVSRGVVFAIIGGFLIYAGFRADPEQAGGLAEALGWVRRQPFGAALFLMVAAGLLAFGVYGFIEAVYRRIGSVTPLLPR